MSNLLTRQIETAHKQIKHLYIEKQRIFELMRKSEDVEYLNDLEQRIVDFDEAIKLQREKVDIYYSFLDQYQEEERNKNYG